MAEEYDYLFKSIVVGDGGVGKTALTLRFSKGFFTEDYKMTIGVDFHVKTISIDAKEGPIRSKLQIWDTGGQERFSSIRPMYYRGSLGALLIFDLTNSSSFEHLPQWIEEVRSNVKNEIPLLLVGNKSDLVDQRAVSLEEINSFTQNFNLYYMETSAKTGEGVGDCFYILACLMIGSGVPDQLLSNGKVFNPGQISPTSPEAYKPSPTQIQPNDEYSAPPVPEPSSSMQEKPSSSFEPEPEFEYSAPPVPEPTNIQQPNKNPPFESEIEPEIPIPEPRTENPSISSKEFDFKTPEEILAEETSKGSVGPPSPTQESFTKTDKETYTPKAVPFTSNVPVPAPAPEGFTMGQTTPPTASTSAAPAPFSTFNEQSQPKSDSLVDYMPEPILSKKDLKKREKQKKKEEKEKKLHEEKERKLQEERERQQKLMEEKKAKKEKKEKPKKEKKEKLGKIDATTSHPTTTTTTPSQSPASPSLFQALTKKEDEIEKSQSSSFIPFSKTENAQIQEKSNLRIIPNAADIENKPSAFTPIQSTPQTQGSSSERKELIICKNCGAMLSSDYAFCNKCGSQL
ncbi:MAG: GTP-binding protein [Promethearchaeota archaeon]|jgi:Ras-related protein Rab-11A